MKSFFNPSPSSPPSLFSPHLLIPLNPHTPFPFNMSKCQNKEKKEIEVTLTSYPFLSFTFTSPHLLSLYATLKSLPSPLLSLLLSTPSPTSTPIPLIQLYLLTSSCLTLAVQFSCFRFLALALAYQLHLLVIFILKKTSVKTLCMQGGSCIHLATFLRPHVFQPPAFLSHFPLPNSLSGNSPKQPTISCILPCLQSLSRYHHTCPCLAYRPLC